MHHRQQAAAATGREEVFQDCEDDILGNIRADEPHSEARIAALDAIAEATGKRLDDCTECTLALSTKVDRLQVPSDDAKTWRIETDVRLAEQMTALADLQFRLEK